jgi:CRP/FNR family cyclic AMP-dependent transcriptional regulator
MSTQDCVAILRQVPFFESLDGDELEAVARCVVSRRVAAGERVITEGTPGESLHVVLAGSFRVEKRTKGQAVTLSEIGPGGAFGEMSLLEPSPTSASVVAAKDGELLSIGRLDLNVLLNWNTVLASKMWRSFALQLSQRLRDTNERLLERYGKDALQP